MKKYALELHSHAHIVNCNPSRTPVDSDVKLGPDGVLVPDPNLYRSLARGEDGGYSTLYLHVQICLMQFSRFVSICITRGSPSHGLLNVNTPSPALVLKRNTGVLPTLLPKLHGFTIFSMSYTPHLIATLVYCDNVSAVYMSANPVQHQRTKHIEIDIHFVRDMVKARHVRVLHVPSRFQYVDIFTKRLPLALFEDFRSSLSVRPSPAQTAKAY
nr:ribonuclease H-like domain-containing protein [Tanacetum cinerariifolium]